MVMCTMQSRQHRSGSWHGPMLAKSLGIGCGGLMPDPDTTEAQVEAFDQVSYIKIYGRPRKAA